MRNPEKRREEMGLEPFSEYEKLIQKSQREEKKEIGWENKLREIEGVKDSLDEEIDDGIKETVAAINLNGFPTSGSCEGHLDHGTAAPWVEISDPNEPEERFVGEKDVFKRVAEKYGVPSREVRQGIKKNAWAEALEEISEAEETLEYKKWREENEKLMAKLSELLAEFYRDRNAQSDIRLEISKIGPGGVFRVHNGGEDYKLDLEDLTEREKAKISQRLLKYQKEMQEFCKFLKEKYFQE